jgi:hypothetical protein
MRGTALLGTSDPLDAFVLRVAGAVINGHYEEAAAVFCQLSPSDQNEVALRAINSAGASQEGVWHALTLARASCAVTPRRSLWPVVLGGGAVLGLAAVVTTVVLVSRRKR